MRIVFQGDSITDCNRIRTETLNLGEGYVREVGAALPMDWPKFNRGISGNRVYDLESRWQEDCLDLKPNLVTILIGINDTWRRYDSRVISETHEFEESLKRISEQVKDAGAKLILLEPFVLPFPDDRVIWREDLDPRIHAVRRVATEHADALVPLDGIFAAATCRYPLADLAHDGVHPSNLGHKLIAEHLLAAIREVTGT
jgi:acyl-CoA thioesterase-1